jgi:hypothetical protein
MITEQDWSCEKGGSWWQEFHEQKLILIVDGRDLVIAMT